MKPIVEMMSMRGRVAAITGGAGHIGRVFADALASLGCAVCLLDIAGERAQAEAERLRSEYGVRASAFAVDLAEEAAVSAAAEHIQREHGTLDVLVNNAAYAPSALAASAAKAGTKDGQSLEEQTAAQWDPNVAVSLRGTFLMTRALAPLLRKSQHAAVINIASIYGIAGPDMRLYDGLEMTNPAWYAAAKGGIVQLTRYCATTLAPSIRVNCIAPGGVLRGQPESFVEKYVERTPLKRMATEEDLRGALIYFASDLSVYVTGQILAVDGGWTAW